MKRYPILFIVVALAGMSFAKVDLVTLPTRDRTQLTIYESADLTLVRDSRDLTLKEGQNRLQFSWAGTLIDPTSLSMLPRAHATSDRDYRSDISVARAEPGPVDY